MIPLVQALTICGMLIYVIIPNPKVSEVGRIMLSWGVLALFLHWVGIR